MKGVWRIAYFKRNGYTSSIYKWALLIGLNETHYLISNLIDIFTTIEDVESQLFTDYHKFKLSVAHYSAQHNKQEWTRTGPAFKLSRAIFSAKSIMPILRVQ